MQTAEWKGNQMASKIMFRAGEMENISPVFVIEKQVTITGVGLHDNDQITVIMAKLKAGDLGFTCDCINQPPSPAAIESYEPLMCGDCIEGGKYMPVRLTKNNPVIVLDAPQRTALFLKYEGDGVGQADVFLETDTDTKDLTPAMRGCPDVCSQTEPNWQETGDMRCNLETNMVECMEQDGLGNSRWTACAELVWTDTGATQLVEENGVEVVKKQQVNACGDYRWENVDPQTYVWQYTGNQECSSPGDTDDQYYVLREYRNQYGQAKWEQEGQKEWQNTGVTACVNNLVNYQQINICGETRWKVSDETCGYIATLALPSGDLMFRPGQQDPAATVEMKDLNDTVIGYIYPEPREGATAEVFADCGGLQTLLGYAVNGNPCACGSSSCSSGMCGMGGKKDVTVNVENLPPLVIKNLPEAFDGIIKRVPDLAIKEMPYLDVRRLPELVVKSLPKLEVNWQDKVDINIVRMPVVAVQVFNKNGQDWILFSDGTFRLLDMPPVEPIYRVRYINNVYNVGAPPVDMQTYKAGDLVTVLGWDLDDTDVRFVFWSYDGMDFVAGDTFRMGANDAVMFANLEAQITFDSGTTDVVENMPTDDWVLMGKVVQLSVPTRENYRFMGWDIDGQLYTESEIEVNKPMNLVAQWEEGYRVNYSLGAYVTDGDHPVDPNLYFAGEEVKSSDWQTYSDSFVLTGWVRESGEIVVPGATFIKAPNTETLTGTYDILVQYFDAFNHATTLPEKAFVKEGTSIALGTPEGVEAGWEFAGWKEETTNVEYAAGEQVTVNKPMRFTATWRTI